MVVFCPNDEVLPCVLLARESRRVGEGADVGFRETSALVLWLGLRVAKVDILVVDSGLST